MNIYTLTIGCSCLFISSLAFWKLLIIGSENKKITLIILFSLIVTWFITIQFGVSSLIGLLGLSSSFIISVVTIFTSIYINKKTSSDELSKELMQEIELAYIEEYKYWTNRSDGPSLLGTMNDYNRMLGCVLGPFEEKYPTKIVNNREKIYGRLKEITKTIN